MNKLKAPRALRGTHNKLQHELLLTCRVVCIRVSVAIFSPQLVTPQPMAVSCLPSASRSSSGTELSWTGAGGVQVARREKEISEDTEE